MPVRVDRRRTVRGAGTIAMVMVLLLIAHLSLLYSHRALLFEQRASASQIRAVRAQEAAQAGLDWAIARLNDPRAMDTQCQPAAQAPDAPPATVRARWTRAIAAAHAWQPACVQAPGEPAWHCQCPDAGAGQVALPAAAEGDTPAFSVSLQTGARPDLWTLTAEGCSHPGPGCGASAHPEPDGRYRVETVLAALGHVVAPPLAALTSVQSVRLFGGSSVVNADPGSGGTTVHTGGTVALDAPARLFGPAGQPPMAGIVAHDSALALGAEALWRRVFGLDAASLRALPTWHPLACASGCTGADLDRAVRIGTRALWLEGDLHLASGRWGSAEAPLLLAVQGRLQIGPDAVLHGLVVAGQVEIHPLTGPRSLLRGALLSTGPATLGGAFDLVRDPAVLDRVALLGGVLAPVPGSWFDPHTR